MRVAIHQPEFFPWIGFFDKMKRVDTYVIFDHVQFKKRYFENRNRLKIKDDSTWVTLPVLTKGRFNQRISDVEINDDINWQKKMFAKLQHCSVGTPYGKQTVESLRPIIIERKYNNLIDFNLSIIDWFRDQLGILTPTVFSSSLGVDKFTSSQLILEICKKINAKTYLCGNSGKDYLMLDDFTREGIDVEWQNFDHPEYRQSGQNFVPYLSSLDFIFNFGPHSMEYFNETIVGSKNERN